MSTSLLALDDFEDALKTFLSRNGKRKDLPQIMASFMACSDVSSVFKDRTMQLHDICVRLKNSGFGGSVSVDDCWRYYWKTMFAQQVPSHSELDDFVAYVHQSHVQSSLEMSMQPAFTALCHHAKEDHVLLQKWISQMLDPSRTLTHASLYVYMFDTMAKKHLSFVETCGAIDRIYASLVPPSSTTQRVIAKLMYGMRKRSGFLDWALDAQHDPMWWTHVSNVCCRHMSDVSDEFPTAFVRQVLLHVDLVHYLHECQRIRARQVSDKKHHLGVPVDFATRYGMAEFTDAFSNIPSAQVDAFIYHMASFCAQDQQHDTFLDFVQHYVRLNGSTHPCVWGALLRYPDDRVKGYAVLQMMEQNIKPNISDYIPVSQRNKNSHCMAELVELFFDAKTRDPLLQLFISMPENVQIFKDWYATLTPSVFSANISTTPSP